MKTNSLSFIQSKNVYDYRPIFNGLVEDFGMSYYHTILVWCDVIEDTTPDQFWEVYLIMWQGQVIGICGLYSLVPNDTSELWLGWLGIIPEHRNSGFGKEVLDFLHTTAKGYGATIMRSYVDKEGKPLSFYYRNGYKYISTVGEYLIANPDLSFAFESEEDIIIENIL